MGQAEASTLLISTIVHFGLILLPCLALCVVAARRGIHDPILIGLIALFAIGSSGYLGFWLWFISPQLSRLFSLCLPIVAALFLIWSLPRLDTAGRRRIKTLVTPISLVGAAAMLVLSTGFMFGVVKDPS